ncbi:hypothetical protein D3C85_1087050 [compost metagenome]
MGVEASVFQGQFDLGRVVTDVLQLAAFQFAAQFQQFRRRLRDIDVDRVKLLDDGHGVGLAVVDQRTLGDGGTADTTTQGGQDLGVAQVDLGGPQGCLGLQTFGLRVVVFLAADCLFGYQLLVTIGQ